VLNPEPIFSIRVCCAVYPISPCIVYGARVACST